MEGNALGTIGNTPQTTPGAHEGDYALAVAHLKAMLRASRLWPGLSASRSALEAGIDALDRARSDLHGSLWVLLLGGTGVGKSTLLDALAGRVIAPASVKRPTTVRTTYYAHRDANLSPLGAIPVGEGVLVTHEIEALRDKVVIDPPDFDSSVDANRKRVMPLLGAADLVITVVDREKYRDEALYRLLQRYRGEKSFLFVANKVDQGFPDEVLDDFRSALLSAGFESVRTLRCSALAALRRRLEGKAPESDAGDFAELEEIISRELTRARIREIKRVNLTGIAAHAVRAFEDAVGHGAQERVDGWLRECNRISATATGRLRAQFSAAVLGSGAGGQYDAMRSYLHGLQLFSFSGVFGTYLAFVERLKAFLGRAWARPVDTFEARALAESRVRSVDAESLRLVLSGASGEVASALTAAGLNTEATRSRLEPGRSGVGVQALAAEAAGGAADALATLTEASMKAKWYSPRNLFYNLIPTALAVAIPAYAAFALVVSLLGKDELLVLGGVSDGAALGAIALVTVCFFQKLAVERSIARGSAKAMTDVGNRMAIRIDGCMKDRFLGPCEVVAREATSALADLAAAERAVSRASSAEPDGK
jgi:energy-coupling factor transporter ATP-binding protein EcfA2